MPCFTHSEDRTKDPKYSKGSRQSPCPVLGLNVIQRLTLHMAYHCTEYEVFIFYCFRIQRHFRWPRLTWEIVCHTKTNCSYYQLDTHCDKSCILYIIILLLHVKNPSTKFEVSSFSHSMNMSGV